jgi:cysteinyl-tRNA synthetase
VDLLNQYTKKYTDAFIEDLKTLNIFQPNGFSGDQYKLIVPRATDEIPAMIKLIEQLIKNSAAYVADGSVYYRVASFPKYGKLSKKDLKGNIKGARVDVDEYDKEEGADFALWKKAKENEPSWDSPWGKGRPGWHLECSVMSMKCLGETFDIHAGGEDLIFPHHENEIAQSEAATGKPFVKYWLHAKHLLVNGEKMSKSKGNYYTLRDLIAKGYDPMTIRYALLSVHYRRQLNFTLENLKEAREAIEKLDNCYAECLKIVNAEDGNKDHVENTARNQFETYLKARFDEIIMALGNDLNISEAFASLFESLRMINIQIGLHQITKIEKVNAVRASMDFFKKVDALFGFDITSMSSIPDNIRTALEQYAEARKARDFARSDLMRQKIVDLGWLVKDGRPGELSTVKKIRRVWDLKK